MLGEVEKHLTLTYVSNKDKTSLLKQLRQVWEQTEVKPARLEELEPQIPEAGMDLWFIFWDLRTSENITWTEIKSYLDYYELDLQPSEIEIIMSMDNKANSFIRNKEIPKTDNSPTK